MLPEPTHNIESLTHPSQVTVFAPHPDDEVIGCGGTITMHARSGDHVTVVFLTNGSHEENHGDGARIRAREAMLAAQTLGVNNTIFLDIGDRELRFSEDSVFRLRDVIRHTNPERIYIPSVYERHPDHFETNRIAKAAARKTKKRIPALSYEVWTPIPYPDIAIDITDVLETKVRALKCYDSKFGIQSTALDAFISLSRYRGYSSFSGGYAECFIREIL